MYRIFKVFHAITEYESQIFANDLKMLIQTLSVKAQHKIVKKKVCTLWACVKFYVYLQTKYFALL